MITRVCLALFVLAAGSARAEWTLGKADILATPSRGLTVREATVSDGPRQATVTAITFSEKSHLLRVVDSPSPGNTKLAAVMESEGLAAGVNGGYFHDDFRPVGLLVANGKSIHGFERAKLLSGVLAIRPGKIEIVRSGQFEAGKNLLGAIQCGPMLVENGDPVAGLQTDRHARRTVIATDGRGRWALVYITSVTLADAAQILRLPGLFGEWTPRTALNLDGGSSSGLWARSSPAPISRPEFSNVRNYLGLIPK